MQTYEINLWQNKKVIEKVVKQFEQELKDTLDKSITQETINQWGKNEMFRHVRNNYGPNPEAKGYDDKH